jgi:hypothetical protein
MKEPAFNGAARPQVLNERADRPFKTFADAKRSEISAARVVARRETGMSRASVIGVGSRGVCALKIVC